MFINQERNGSIDFEEVSQHEMYLSSRIFLGALYHRDLISAHRHEHDQFLECKLVVCGVYPLGIDGIDGQFWQEMNLSLL